MRTRPRPYAHTAHRPECSGATLSRVLPSLLAAILIAVAPAGAARAQAQTSNPARDYVEARTTEVFRRVVGTAVPNHSPAPRIVGGTTARPGSNPFQVALLLKSQSSNFQAQYCGGSLVAGRFVVTAAHCSDFVTPGEVQVLTDTRRLDGSGSRRNVVAITVHPAFDSRTMDNDIAVWELASEVTGVPFAQLPPQDAAEPITKRITLATGWGRDDRGLFPIDFMQAKLKLIPRAECNVSYQGAITQNMVCAGLRSGGRDTCQGDSGGPLTRKRLGAFVELTGITSWGNGCGLAGYPGVYTRVARFTDFIQGIVER